MNNALAIEIMQTLFTLGIVCLLMAALMVVWKRVYDFLVRWLGERSWKRVSDPYAELAHQDAVLTSEPYPRIRKTSGVMGGAACIRDTRIAVWALWQQRCLGWNDRDILLAYPSLCVEDLKAAWQYAEDNVDEINREIQEEA